MNILMVNPYTAPTFWSFKHALKFVSKKSVLPPLGLMTVAAMLPKSWNIKLIDMVATDLADDDIRWADYVFITAMNIQKESVRQILQRCKKIGTKTVAGGPLFTLMPEEYADIDHLVLNEAEVTLPDFLNDLQYGCTAHIYTSEKRADMNDSPVPRWDLINLNNYASMCIQYSRGCPFDCDFCDITARFGHQCRTKNKDQILAELESLYSLGWRDKVFFVDDNLIGNKNRLKNEILPAMIQWFERRNRPFTYNTQVSINLADDTELMELMAQAGFNCVFVGIETPSEAGLAECNKTQNRSRNLIESVRRIQNAGIEVQGGFILGFDSDNNSIFEKLSSFIQESGIVTAMVGLLNAPIGTRLYDRLVRQNRLINDASGDNTDFTMNFIPAMPYRELLAGYKEVVRKLYSEKNYCERIFTFLKNYKPVNNISDRTNFTYIKAFIKSLWKLGFMHKGRRYYWKVVIWAILHPRFFNRATTLTIYGYHFQKMFEELGRAAERRKSDFSPV